jgi:prefoldin subunit 5
MDVPISQVVQMQQNGMTNNQIMQTLMRQGYQPQLIYDAMAQAEARKTIEPMEPHVAAPEEQHFGPSEPTHPPSEAIVEQLIEEKWRELQKDVSKITEFKETITSRIDKLEQSVSDIRMDLEGLHKAIVARIGEYDKSLLDVGTEITAMEKVFQKVLPDLTGSVQELSKITKDMKKK